MKISCKVAVLLLFVLLIVLLVGTQMPGAWRNAIQRALNPGFILSSWAHFAIFAAMAGLTVASPLSQPALRVTVAALFLSLLTEGLQSFAIDRHPGWDDVAIDMAGSAWGMLLVRFHESYQRAKRPLSKCSTCNIPHRPEVKNTYF